MGCTNDSRTRPKNVVNSICTLMLNSHKDNFIDMVIDKNRVFQLYKDDTIDKRTLA